MQWRILPRFKHSDPFAGQYVKAKMGEANSIQRMPLIRIVRGIHAKGATAIAYLLLHNPGILDHFRPAHDFRADVLLEFLARAGR